MGGMARIARFSDKKLYNAQPCLLCPAFIFTSCSNKQNKVSRRLIEHILQFGSIAAEIGFLSVRL